MTGGGLRSWLAWLPQAALLGLARALPYRARLALGSAVLRAAVALVPGLRARVENNLKLIFPEMPPEERTRIRRAMADSFGRTLLETVTVPQFHARAAWSEPAPRHVTRRSSWRKRASSSATAVAQPAAVATNRPDSASGVWKASTNPSGIITQKKATKKAAVVTQLSPSARVVCPSTTCPASNTIETARIAMIGAARAISEGSAL